MNEQRESGVTDESIYVLSFKTSILAALDCDDFCNQPTYNQERGVIAGRNKSEINSHDVGRSRCYYRGHYKHVQALEISLVKIKGSYAQASCSWPSATE